MGSFIDIFLSISIDSIIQFIVRVILELTMLYTNFSFQLRLELCADALCS